MGDTFPFANVSALKVKVIYFFRNVGTQPNVTRFKFTKTNICIHIASDGLKYYNKYVSELTNYQLSNMVLSYAFNAFCYCFIADDQIFVTCTKGIENCIK